MAKEVVNYTTKLRDSGDRRAFSSGAVRDMGGGKGRCDLLPLSECATLLADFSSACKKFSNSITYMNTNSEALILDAINSALKKWNKALANNVDPDLLVRYIYEINCHLYDALNAFLFFNYYCEDSKNIFETMTLHDWIEMINNDNPENKDEAIKRAYTIIPNDAILALAKHFEDGSVKYGDRNWEKGIPFNVFIDSAIRHYLKICRGDTDEPHARAFMWNIICAIWTLKNYGFEMN